jgi:hypothetical protein
MHNIIKGKVITIRSWLLTTMLQQISKGHILLSLAELWSTRTELGWTVAYITKTRTNIASIAAQAHNNTRVQLVVSSAIQDSSASPDQAGQCIS